MNLAKDETSVIYKKKKLLTFFSVSASPQQLAEQLRPLLEVEMDFIGKHLLVVYCCKLQLIQ